MPLCFCLQFRYLETSMNKLRIIQVVNVRWLNATAWYGLFLSRLLKEAGHEVVVLGLGGTQSFEQATQWGLEPRRMSINTSNPLKVAGLYLDMQRLIREFRPQVVNCHRGEGFALWAMLKNKDFPFVLARTRGDQRPPKNNLPNRLIYRKFTDALIATNSRIAGIFTEEFAVPQDKVHTIIGGVDEKVFYQDRIAGESVRANLGYAPSDFVVGLLGRLDRVKGHEVLIAALGKLKQKYASGFNLRFLCIGAPSGLADSDLAVMLRRAGLYENSAITGRVENIRGHINALDIGVLASVGSEAIARAALEIMACGVPLLSTDVGVMPDLLPKDLLVPAGDSHALGLALEDCWKGSVRIENLKQAGSRAMASLSSGHFLEKTLRVYNDCLSGLGRG